MERLESLNVENHTQNAAFCDSAAAPRTLGVCCQILSHVEDVIRRHRIDGDREQPPSISRPDCAEIGALLRPA
eukprot:5581444-Pleurochrysis_carterae.AAC.2